jgi:tetratricopeptide (TPR) repeat protein
MQIVLKLATLIYLGTTQVHSTDWSSEHDLATIAYGKGEYAIAEQHDRAALALADSLDENDFRLDPVLTQLGAVIQARGICCEAEQLMQRALKIRMARYGDDSVEVAMGKHNLAAVWQQSGRAKDAAKLQAEALATAQRLLQSTDPALIPHLTLAALVERDARHYDRAEELLKQSLALAESEPGEHPRRSMQASKYLGTVYRAAGRFDDAERVYKGLLDRYEAAFGADSLDVANTLNTLGALRCQRKFYADGRSYLERAVATYQRIHDTGSSFLAALETLSTAELYLGHTDLAEEHALQSLSMAKNQTSGDHDALAIAHNNLSQVYARQGRTKEAEEAAIRARDLWIASAGPDSPKVAAALSNLGALYVQGRKYKKAEALYTESAAIDSKATGQDGLDYARDLNRLGVLYNVEKQFAKSETVLREALAIESAKLTKNSPVLAEAYINLACSLHGQRRREEALEDFQRGIQIMTLAGQKNTPDMSVVLNHYSALLRELELWAEAEKASTEALGIIVRQKVHPESYR